MNKEVIYILEDYWFGQWHLIREDTNKQYLEDHAKDLEERIGKYIKYKWQIREKK
jgi:hypothetical protein